MQRGEYSAREGTGGTLAKNYVYLAISDKDTKVTSKVKAVALMEVEDNSISQAYYNHIFASSGGAEWQYPWTDKDDFQNYWKGSKCDMSPTDWQFFYERGNGAVIKHNFLPVWSYKTTPLQKKGLNFGIGASQGKIQHPFSWDTKLTN